MALKVVPKWLPCQRLALKGDCKDWVARRQDAVTRRDSKFDVQLPSQCGSADIFI